MIEDVQEIIKSLQLKKYSNDTNNNNNNTNPNKEYLNNKKQFVNKMFNDTREVKVNMRKLQKSFQVLYHDPNRDKPIGTPDFWTTIQNNSQTDIKMDLEITLDDYFDAIKYVHLQSAVGPDVIPYSIYKDCKLLAIIMVKFFNLFILYGKIPKWWDLSKVILLDKNKDNVDHIINVDDINNKAIRALEISNC